MKALRLVALVAVVAGAGVTGVLFATAPHASAQSAPCVPCGINASRTLDCGSGVTAEVYCWLGSSSEGSRSVGFSVMFMYKQVLVSVRHFNGLVSDTGADPWVVPSVNIDLETCRVFAADALGVDYSYDSADVVDTPTIQVKPAEGKTWAEVSDAEMLLTAANG